MTVDSNKTDMHLHTVVSDGFMTPMEILVTAQELGLEKISITDHDAVGAYTHFDPDLFGRADDMGILLVPGIELDSEYKNVEIHILGYGIDIHHPDLTAYLKSVQGPRRRRVREQIEQINKFYKKEIITEEEVFISHRDTMMKPHLVRALLDNGLFNEYREASRWLSRNIKVPTEIPKPHPVEMVELIRAIGGRAYLAHPGFYIVEWNVDIDQLLSQLKPVGLEGLEVEYRYYGSSPDFDTPESEEKIITFLREKAQAYDLLTSRGSDAHSLESMKTFN